MTRAIHLIAAILAISALSPALADEDPLSEVFTQHMRLIRELSKHVVLSDQAPPPIPRQKNYASPATKDSNTTFRGQDSAPQEVPRNLTFTAKTVWANLTVNITAFPTRFNAVVLSDTPVQGWLIKRSGSKQVIAKGGVSESRTFTIEINEPYESDMELTCMINKDGFTNPALVPLR